MTKCPGDPPTNTRTEKIGYLCEGSPKLRYQLLRIQETILRPNYASDIELRKILGVEDCPDAGCFWELVLQALYINARVVHAGLPLKDRNRPIRVSTTAMADSISFTSCTMVRVRVSLWTKSVPKYSFYVPCQCRIGNPGFRTNDSGSSVLVRRASLIYP